MEEEISLREIIEKLWNGKWIIISITVLALLISIVYSFVIVDPVYRGTAKVTIHNVTSVPETVQPYITELTTPEIFVQALKSDTVLHEVIEQEDLDLTVGKLQSSIKVELPGETTSILSISLEGTDPERIKTVVDTAISLTQEEMNKNIDSRLSLFLEEYHSIMVQEDERLEEAVIEYNEIGAGDGLPSLFLFQQNTSDGQYMLEANEELLNEFKTLEKTEQIKYEMINEKIKNLTSLYNFYSNKYDEVQSISTMNLVELSTNVLSETFVPKKPVSPNKILILSIAVVLGIMLGAFIVFITDLLKNVKGKSKESSLTKI